MTTAIYPRTCFGGLQAFCGGINGGKPAWKQDAQVCSHDITMKTAWKVQNIFKKNEEGTSFQNIPWCSDQNIHIKYPISKLQKFVKPQTMPQRDH